ncbi:protein SPT2 homolog [Saccostrea cucullata]|uniref:protein SPT2 homolog n=1 Tax=Saccostrea cuccullata TaxID=36930 RepID=UPI002ED512B8
MDFQNILSIAAQNSSSKQVKKVFSTQLAPPKKEKKDKEVKSEVVKKLIEEKEREKREAEEARERIKRKIEEAKERKKREKELKLKREKEEEERRRKEEEKKNRFRIPRKGESTTEKNEIKSSTSTLSGSTSSSSKSKTAALSGKSALQKNSESRKSDVVKKHKSDAKVKNHVDKVSDKLKNSSSNSEGEKIDPTTVKPTAISSQQRSSHLYDSIEKKIIKNETEVERKRREFEEKRARLLQQIKAKGVETEKPVVVKKTEKSKSSKDFDRKSEKKNKSEKLSEQEKISDKLNNKSSLPPGKQELSKPSVSEKIKAHNSGKKMPPPMGFSDLLKLAQVKASEPVTMESLKKVDKPRKETDRLMTKEERDRYMEEQACRQRKSSSSVGKAQSSSGSINDKSSSNKRENGDGNPKHSKEKSIRENREDRSSPKLKNLLINGVESSSPETSKISSKLKRKSEVYSNSKPSSQMISKSSSSSALHRPQNSSDAKKRRVDSPSMSKSSTSSPSSGRMNGQTSHKPAEKRRAYDSENENVLVCGPPKPKPEAALNPFDRIYGQIKKNHPKPEMKKRRIESDEEDSEYDEEMEGFITDEGSDLEEDHPQDMDYSKHIRQIFGYDRRKYKYESDRDIANMESNFAQQMKEEARSARLGLQEDLEDIRREEEELKRKMEKKKR